MSAINREKIIKSAQKFVAQGRFENAIKEYEKLLEQDGSDPLTLNTIGDLNLHLNRSQTAISYFKRAAQRYIDDGFYGKGLAVYRKIVRADARNLENAEVLADLFIKEGVLSDAKRIYADIGRAYIQSNNFSKAYQVFKKLADLTQDDPNIHLKLAELSIKLNLAENARESYLNAALICSRRGDYQQGMNAIQMALEIDPLHMGSLKILFKISLELRDFQLLSKQLSRALEKNPDNRELKEMLGQSFMFQGEFRQALALFIDLMNQDESKSFLIKDLAEMAANNGDVAIAFECLTNTIEGMLARRENQRVMELLNLILAKEPYHTGALTKLAELYYQSSDTFKYVETLDKLSEAAMRERNYQEALAILEKLINMDGSNEKYLKVHREAFEKAYPGETYTPLGAPASEEALDAEGSLFEFDTTELASGRAFEGIKDSDATLEVELLLSYGLKDKAKAKLAEKIQHDPQDLVFREKLMNIYKEEGVLKQAADICFEMANILTLKGDHDKASAYLEEGRSMDPGRDDVSIPTGILSGSIRLPEEADVSTTGFDLLEIEGDAVDLTDDLSDILVGMDSPADLPAAVPDFRPAPAAASSEGESGPARKMDTDINLRLEETLKSLQELGFNSTNLFQELMGEKPVAEAPPPPQPPRPAPQRPAKPPEPVPASTATVSQRRAPDQSEKLAPPVEAAAKPVITASADQVKAKAATATASTPKPAVSTPAKAEPPAAAKTVSASPRESVVEEQTPAVQDRELSASLQEIDFYIKLGFESNARDELSKLAKTYPGHPDIVTRLQSLGVRPVQPEPAEEGLPREEDLFPAPTIEIQQIPKSTTKTPPPDTGASLDVPEITADEVNIDLFNFISADALREETERPSSSYEVRKNIPQLDQPAVSPPGLSAGDDPGLKLFEDLEPDEVIDNALLFGEEKPSMRLSKDGLFLPREQSQDEAKKTEGQGQNLTAMHNIFADIVEEANKVFISNVQESDADFDTHYNLGIAYKEMALIDDAVSEFQKAFNLVKDHPESPSYIRACHLLSLSLMEKGLYKSAVKWCERGLNSPKHSDHEYQAIRYDMARAWEMQEDYKTALEVYTDIYEQDANYRDVAEKIKLIRNRGGK